MTQINNKVGLLLIGVLEKINQLYGIICFVSAGNIDVLMSFTLTVRERREAAD